MRVSASVHARSRKRVMRTLAQSSVCVCVRFVCACVFASATRLRFGKVYGTHKRPHGRAFAKMRGRAVDVAAAQQMKSHKLHARFVSLRRACVRRDRRAQAGRACKRAANPLRAPLR